MKKVYIGGSLFTDKQIKQRIAEENILKGLFDYNIYNPITNDEINDKTKKPTAQDIFEQDTREIIKSDIILADLDDNDIGLAMELGIAYMTNYMRARIIECMISESPVVEMNRLLDEIPSKKVYATCSDIRQDTEDEEGIYKSWGQNAYVIGGIEKMGSIHRNLREVIKDIRGESE